MPRPNLAVPCDNCVSMGFRDAMVGASWWCDFVMLLSVLFSRQHLGVPNLEFAADEVRATEGDANDLALALLAVPVRNLNRFCASEDQLAPVSFDDINSLEGTCIRDEVHGRPSAELGTCQARHVKHTQW